ncbi:MAG: sigma-70 family RNA polymerase sigma factor [Nitrospirae bacterium]|nr:sigma-70 family RNA polymerase sigma factor [Nitrospirota bacterium]
MNFPDDIELVTRCKGGDQPAFEQLVLKYQNRIYNLCRHMIQDAGDAQDAAQDVFIKAYGNLKGYRPDASLYTWLYRIAINTCLDYSKKSRPEPFDDESAVDILASAQPSPERLYQSKETGRLIEAALQKLPKKLRAAIVLKEIEDLSYEEIADTLDTSIGTVKSRISRAREELRKLLESKL